LKVPYLDHDDFETHGGVLQARFTYDLRLKDSDSPSAVQVEAMNRLVDRAALTFLNGTLLKDEHALQLLDNELPAQWGGAKLLHIAHPPRVNLADLLQEIRAAGVQAAASRCAATPGCDESALFADAGEQFSMAGDWDTAVKVLQWVVQRHPDSFAAHNGLADALLALHRDSEALTAYQGARAVLQRVPMSPAGLHQAYDSRLRKRIQFAGELVAKGR
jgi:hypothetical protein